MAILGLVYAALGYWATGKTIYANRILIGTSKAIMIEKLVTGFLLGWILIPIAIIKTITGK